MRIKQIATNTGTATVLGNSEYEVYQNMAELHFNMGLTLDEMEKDLQKKKGCGTMELEGTVIGNFIKKL